MEGFYQHLLMKFDSLLADRDIGALFTDPGSAVEIANAISLPEHRYVRVPTEDVVSPVIFRKRDRSACHIVGKAKPARV